jgi:hypothetical protein
MKRFGTLLIAVMLGLLLACGTQEPKAPCTASGFLDTSFY